MLTEELIQQFHKFSEKGKAYDCIDARIANHIIENNDLMVISGIPYYYASGVFRVDEKGIMIKTLIRHCIVEEVQTAPRIKRVYELLITDYRIQREPDEINLYPKHWINFLNGMLDVKTGEMHSHSPEYKAISQIPHNYIPGLNLENTIFYEFLQSRIPDRDNQKMLFEFLGMCLFSEIFFQKFMILTGKGNCGKSIILNELLRLTGIENASAIPLQKISDRFTTAKLLYKTVNVCGDLENAMVSRSSFCVRKVQDMARNNGFELKVPSEAGANLVIDEADRKVREVIEKYDGDPKFTGSTGGHYVSIKMNANGRFLDSLEAKYADETVEDVTITTLSKKEYTKMQQKTAEEAENEGVEVTEVGNLGINAKSTNNGSPAAKYAKAYSERMSTVNPEFE